MNRKQSPAPRQAIALSYDGQAAPTLSAKGDAELAEAYLANALFDAHRDDPEFGYRYLADEARDAGHAAYDRTM